MSSITSATKVDGYELGGLEDEEGNLGSLCNSSFPDPVDLNNPCALILDGSESAAKLQPKLSLAWSPTDRLPFSFYLNYGRGISSQDARGCHQVARRSKISTTDFYQAGTSFPDQKISFVFSTFLIDRSHEQVYIPDDGSIEFAGRTRSYGIELRNSLRLTKWLSFNGG